MYTLYHNPRCSKSREALAMLEKASLEFKVREYLKEPLNEDELGDLFAQLSEEDKSLIVRIKEQEYKDDSFELDDSNLVINHLAQKPKLMERPILSNGKKAIIARPPTKIQQFI